MPVTEAEPPEAPELRDELLGNNATVSGPQAPLAGLSAPSEQAEWSRTPVEDHRLLTVAGLHGGAGTSTVARLLGDDAFDAGTGWPIAAGWVRPLPRLSVVAVTRTHEVGIEAAEIFTQQWLAGQLHESRLLGLIIVDDAPKLLDSQQRAVKRLLRKTPLGAHIPWVPAWRIQKPETTNLPRRLQKIVRAYHQLAEKEES